MVFVVELRDEALRKLDIPGQVAGVLVPAVDLPEATLFARARSGTNDDGVLAVRERDERVELIGLFGGRAACGPVKVDEQGRRLGEVKASLEAMRRELWDGVVRAEVVDERGEPPVPEPAPVPPPEAPSPEMSAMQDGDA